MGNLSLFFEQNFGTFAPYTWFNTFVYGIILSFAVFLLLLAFKRQKIKLDRNFFIAVAPWVVFGATARALVDAHFFLTNWFFVAPGIYFLMFILFFIVWRTSIFVSRFFKIGWWKLTFGIGFVLMMFNLVNIGVRAQNILALLLILSIFSASFFPFLYASKVIKQLSLQNLLVIGAHLFDASATFVGLTFFHYTEKHVLPTAIMGAFGPAAFFVLKLLVILAFLVLVDHFIKDKNTNNGLKFVVFVLGCAPGIRDTCRLIMGC